MSMRTTDYNTSKRVVTISSGESLSDGIVVNSGGDPDNPQSGFRLAGIEMPSTWTSADLTFQVSSDGITYRDLKDMFGSEIVVTASSDDAITIPPLDFIGWAYLKIRSGTSGTPVTQSGDREIGLALKQL